jgi:hypothetical protein
VNVEADLKTVNGVGGTTWLTSSRGPGDVILIPCSLVNCTDGTPYIVAAVNSETRLTLAAPFAGAPGPYSYSIRRQFQAAAGNATPALIAWEDCI